MPWDTKTAWTYQNAGWVQMMTVWTYLAFELIWLEVTWFGPFVKTKTKTKQKTNIQKQIHKCKQKRHSTIEFLGFWLKWEVYSSWISLWILFDQWKWMTRMSEIALSWVCISLCKYLNDKNNNEKWHRLQTILVLTWINNTVYRQYWY